MSLNAEISFLAAATAFCSSALLKPIVPVRTLGTPCAWCSPLQGQNAFSNIQIGKKKIGKNLPNWQIFLKV
jgi:hypothetical protein